MVVLDDQMLNHEKSDRRALPTVKKKIETTPNRIHNCTTK